jgi:hypothetical protein
MSSGMLVSCVLKRENMNLDHPKTSHEGRQDHLLVCVIHQLCLPTQLRHVVSQRFALVLLDIQKVCSQPFVPLPS